QADPVNGRNGGDRQLLQPPEHRLPGRGLRGRFRRIRDALDLGDVRPGDEHAGLPAAYDDRLDAPRARAVLDLAEERVEALHAPARQDVDPAVGPVKDEPGDAVAVYRQRQRRLVRGAFDLRFHT